MQAHAATLGLKKPGEAACVLSFKRLESATYLHGSAFDGYQNSWTPIRKQVDQSFSL